MVNILYNHNIPVPTYQHKTPQATCRGLISHNPSEWLPTAGYARFVDPKPMNPVLVVLCLFFLAYQERSEPIDPFSVKK